MFSLFKSQNNDPEIPKWASFFTAQEYKTFVKALDKYFRKKNISYTLGDAQITVDPNDLGFSTLGLTNISQVCKQDEPENYESLVASHFEAMLRSNKFQEAFEKIEDDFEQVKQYLGVRLYGDQHIRHLGKEHTVGKEFGGDLYAMLVFDLPDNITNVRPQHADKWGKKMDDLFKTGLENIHKKYPFQITQEEFNDFNIWFVQADHYFVPNIAFHLDQYPHLIGSKGALIGMPHRHAAFLYPIESIEVVKALNGLIMAVYGMNEEGPGSVSNNLFWYYNGKFENLPYKLENNSLQFFPPDNFLELLNSLAPDEDEDDEE